MAEGEIRVDERVITCPLCLDIFCTPRSLPCLHTFCHGCLTKFVTSQLHKRTISRDISQDNVIIVCPECREETHLNVDDSPSALVERFRLNHVIVSIIDAQKAQAARACDPCQVYGSVSRGSYRCSDCDEVYCDRCAMCHQAMKCSKTHNVTPYSVNTICRYNDVSEAQSKGHVIDSEGEVQEPRRLTSSVESHDQLLLVSAKVLLMMYDEVNRRWWPSSELIEFGIYHNTSNNKMTIIGKESDSHEVILASDISIGMKYIQATPIFHQWRDTAFHVYGLKFTNERDADEFAYVMFAALETINDEHQQDLQERVSDPSSRMVAGPPLELSEPLLSPESAHQEETFSHPNRSDLSTDLEGGMQESPSPSPMEMCTNTPPPPLSDSQASSISLPIEPPRPRLCSAPLENQGVVLRTAVLRKARPHSSPGRRRSYIVHSCD
ncbi:hypothetical protein ACJMK2_037567 [Sinanodonta woodiana]|uniref:Uncharacterized protein n=1 Tax=Sinanodonta woodiana TaxID=1069815 RepID=A0ABD3WKU5_SINWO